MGESRINIKVNKDASRLEEVKILEELYDGFSGSGMMLESLFSRELLNWARGKILDGTKPDVYWFFNALLKWKTKELRYEMEEKGELERTSEDTVVALKKELRSANEQKEKAQAEILTLKERVFGLAGDVEQMVERLGIAGGHKDEKAS